MYPTFIHSSVDGHSDCFHVLAIVNSVAMNIGVHASFQIRFFFGCIPRNGVAGSYSSSVHGFFNLVVEKEQWCLLGYWWDVVTVTNSTNENSPWLQYFIV